MVNPFFKIDVERKRKGLPGLKPPRLARQVDA